MIQKLLVLCANKHEKNISNINENVKKIYSIFNKEKIEFIVFHDDVCPKEKYDKRINVVCYDENYGTLYARKNLVESIPKEYDDAYAIWFDGDGMGPIDLCGAEYFSKFLFCLSVCWNYAFGTRERSWSGSLECVGSYSYVFSDRYLY